MVRFAYRTLLVLIVITIDLGGFSWFPTQWNPIWDHQPIVSFDPSTRVTVFSAFLSFLIWYVCTSGGDQTSVQRFMSTTDARAARRASDSSDFGSNKGLSPWLACVGTISAIAGTSQGRVRRPEATRSADAGSRRRRRRALGRVAQSRAAI